MLNKVFGKEDKEKKFKKRVTTFQTDKNPSKRWKSLIKIIEKESPEDRVKFFQENDEAIILILHTTIGELEKAKEKTKKGHEADVLQLLDVIKAALTNLPTKIKTRWRSQDILSLLSKLLARQNKHNIRIVAYEVLLQFIDILVQDGNLSGLDDNLELFAKAFNMAPFSAEMPEARIRYQPPAVDPMLVLVPSPAPENIEESCTFLDVFFDFLTQRTGKVMDFWFEQLRRFYLSQLFPKVFVDLKVIQNDGYGFHKRCPNLLQKTLIDTLDKHKSLATLCTKVWEDNNAPVMFEIARQSYILPVQFAPTIKKSILLFKHYFMTKRVREDCVNQYYQTIVNQYVNVFTLEPSASSEEYLSVFTELLNQYASASLTGPNSVLQIVPQTWETLQMSLLTGALHFFEKLKAMRQDKNIETAAEEIISHLFLVWLRSPVNTDQTWQYFHSQFVTLLEHPQAVRQWKDKLVKLTNILCEFYYKPPVSTEQQQAEPQPAEEGANPMESTIGSAPNSQPGPTTPVKGKAEPFKSKDFVKDYLGITWNEVYIKEVWFTILNICGNINAIKTPYNFEVAISAVSDVVDIFLENEKKIPLKDGPRKIPLIEIFLPWLLQGCYSNVERQGFYQGVIYSLRTLCKLFCRQHKQPLSIDLLSHFYRVLENGLHSEKETVRDTVLTHARYIFSLGLPGASVLIADFLREIANVFSNRPSISADIQRHCVTILNSLISYPLHYDGINLPDFAAQRDMTAPDFRDFLSNMILGVLNNLNLDVTARQMIMWGVCVMLFEEVRTASAGNQRMQVVTGALQILLEQIKSKDEAIAITATEVLNSLTTLIDKFNVLDPNLSYSVVSIICDNINYLMNDGSALSTKEKIISEMFLCLTSWLTSNSNVFLTDPELATKIFQVVEFGLIGKLGVDLTKKVELDPVFSQKIEEDDKDDKKKRGEKKKDNTRNTMRGISMQIQYETLLDKLARQPLHGSTLIQQAAEQFLFTVINFYNNFPAPAGPSQIESSEPDEEEGAVFFAHFERQILSILQKVDPATGKMMARLTVRDPFGKFVWDCEADMADVNGLIDAAYRPPAQLKSQNSSTFAPADNTPCPISDALTGLWGSHREVFNSKLPSALHPAAIRSEFSAEVAAGRGLVDGVVGQDTTTLQSFHEGRQPLDPLKPSGVTPSHTSNFNAGRMFLNSLGYLNQSHRRGLHFIDDSARLRRALTDLDRVKGRELIKIGLVYVGEGQEDQSSILGNDNGSREYHQFLRGLGWTVDLQAHQGFRGGLHLDGTAGTAAPYYSNDRFELIYHVVSWMPTKDSDPKQISKKRHVGNDHVHIIWSEHKRDYDPNVIVSQFNDAHIVIYPQPSGLFRVQIFRKEKLKIFGPLMDGMLVNKQVLSDMIRLTAVNAHRSVRYGQKGYENPYVTRLNYIREATRRYKQPKPSEELYAKFFGLKPEFRTNQAALPNQSSSGSSTSLAGSNGSLPPPNRAPSPNPPQQGSTLQPSVTSSQPQNNLQPNAPLQRAPSTPTLPQNYRPGPPPQGVPPQGMSPGQGGLPPQGVPGHPGMPPPGFMPGGPPKGFMPGQPPPQGIPPGLPPGAQPLPPGMVPKGFIPGQPLPPGMIPKGFVPGQPPPHGIPPGAQFTMGGPPKGFVPGQPPPGMLPPGVQPGPGMPPGMPPKGFLPNPNQGGVPPQGMPPGPGGAPNQPPMMRAVSTGQLNAPHMINQPPKGFIPNPNQLPPGVKRPPGPPGPGTPPPNALNKSGSVSPRPSNQ
jgi:hypothetical protein